MIELRPKAEEISTENLMMFFAECLQKYCSERKGANACNNCPFMNKFGGCSISNCLPEDWSV